jgi:hypothetical protein
MMNAERRMLGNVQSAVHGEVFTALAVAILISFSIIGGAF